jgi:hypothetical protein
MSQLERPKSIGPFIGMVLNTFMIQSHVMDHTMDANNFSLMHRMDMGNFSSTHKMRCRQHIILDMIGV